VRDFRTLGVTPGEDGAVAAVFSAHAKRIQICIFDRDTEVERIILNHGGDHVHRAFVKGLSTGQHYGFRADGVFEPEHGYCFDHSKLLLDPYAREIDRHASWHPELAQFGADTAAFAPKSIVTDSMIPATRRKARAPSFIYEVPVRAFTKLHPDIPPALRGTVAALASESAISHFKRIGCDTIELMPVAAWTDERHLAQVGLRNAWGYNPVSFFAVEPMLAPGGVREVRDTIAALHASGFQVILDVVFNHTGEGDFGGPTLSLRGLDQASYYRMHGTQLVNDTGTGNTLMLDHEPAMNLVLDAMRHWVAVGFDGFRYDLAPVMGRSAKGFSANAPLLAAIQEDPVLRDVIHVAEPWDVGPGGYQLGNFPAGWHEWNDHYRDDVRKYWRGDGPVSALATRLSGSSDIFQKPGRFSSASVNFVAAHDGFALGDAVRFADKRNHANGESNRDGSSHEVAWISQGPDAAVRCLLATLFLSRGVPMLTAGDEFGRTQGGNNNAYAQDNDLTWLNWEEADAGLTAFVGRLTKFRHDHAVFFDGDFLTPENAKWLGSDGLPVDWNSAREVTLVIGTERRLMISVSRDGNSEKVTLPIAGAGLTWKRLAELESVATFVSAWVET
jgi:glycogen debranching enzyme